MRKLYRSSAERAGDESAGRKENGQNDTSKAPENQCSIRFFCGAGSAAQETKKEDSLRETCEECDKTWGEGMESLDVEKKPKKEDLVSDRGNKKAEKLAESHEVSSIEKKKTMAGHVTTRRGIGAAGGIHGVAAQRVLVESAPKVPHAVKDGTPIFHSVNSNVRKAGATKERCSDVGTEMLGGESLCTEKREETDDKIVKRKREKIREEQAVARATPEVGEKPERKRLVKMNCVLDDELFGTSHAAVDWIFTFALNHPVGYLCTCTGRLYSRLAPYALCIWSQVSDSLY